MARRKPFDKTPARMDGPQGPKNFKRTFKRLFSYLLAYKFRLILVCACVLINAGAVVQGSLFLRELIDQHITPLIGIANPDFSGLLSAILIMAGIYLAGTMAGLVYNRVMVIVSQGTQKKIRDQLFSHMQRLPVKYFDSNDYGDLMSRYTNDIDTLRQMLSQTIPQLAGSVVTCVFVLAAMFYTSPALTVLLIVMVFLTMTLAAKIGKLSAGYFAAQQKSLGALNGYIEEMTHGQKVIKVFCYEDEAKQQFNSLNEELRENATKANRLANIMMPLMGNLSNIQYVVVAMAGGAMAVSGIGGLTLGAIAAFLRLVRNFSMPISQVAQQFSFVVMALAGAERIFEMMDEEPETDGGDVALVNAKYLPDGDTLTEAEGRTGIWAWKTPCPGGGAIYTRLTGEVKFFGVDFAYQEGKPVLKDITLFAKPGQKVALVGATGAGKTTIANLINRFYDITDGKIQYDGINIGKIKKGSLRRSLSVVLQDTTLFTATIMENIRFGQLGATDQEVMAAAKLAGADSFISRLPKGYQTEIDGEGSELSQGQRQLIAIARAAVADPPVMILDEATANIDTRTEAIVQRGMDCLMTGRTVFVIAHRLSTVKNADVIMVLDAGKIIERGSHRELITQGGKYYQLYTGVFELE
jgi:ATP-binding cassette subfamily B protein